jgi:hypothetical protein
MNKPSRGRAAAWADRYTEWLVVLVLLAAAFPPVLIRHRSLTVVPSLNLLDGSWALDTAYKAATGVWFGRDVLFTYGPLYQWLSGAPSRWVGISTGTILATATMLPTMLAVLAVFASIRLLLPTVSPWKRALFVALLLWSPPGIRIAICLFAFVVFIRLADRVAVRAGGVVLPGIAAAVLCFACFLVSADAGLYAFAALLLSVAATAFVQRKSRGAVIALGAFLAVASFCIAMLVVATNAVMFTPLNFTYWQSSLKLATGYRWFEAKAMMLPSTWRILGVLALGLAVFGVAWWRREPQGDRWTQRPAFLLAGFCVALVMMQSGLVRSDVIHVVNGIYPLVFLSGAILLGRPTNRPWLSVILVAMFAASLPLLDTPFAEHFPGSLWQAAREVVQPTLTCPAKKQEFDRACFSPADAQTFATVSAYVDQRTSARDPIVVFPYQNAFGVMARSTVSGGVLQSYLVNGDFLTNLDVGGLRKANPLFGLYLPEAGPSFGASPSEGTYSYEMDGVPNFTRSPDVWFYLLRHYRAEGTPAPGIIGLRRDDTRDRRLTFTEESITDPLGTVRVTKRETWLDLGSIHWPAAGADFLTFRVRVDYPFWWKLRKPSSLAVLIHYADRSWRLVSFVVEPNHDSEVWVYPGRTKDMGGYFSDDASQWPAVSPPTRLAVLITPFDWVSVSPQSVTIEAVNAVRLGLK